MVRLALGLPGRFQDQGQHAAVVDSDLPEHSAWSAHHHRAAGVCPHPPRTAGVLSVRPPPTSIPYYAGLVAVFNAEDGRGLGLTATTVGQLADAIGKAHAHKGGPILIECQIPKRRRQPRAHLLGIQGCLWDKEIPVLAQTHDLGLHLRGGGPPIAQESLSYVGPSVSCGFPWRYRRRSGCRAPMPIFL